MKVIDLLNKIAKGEEAPKKIKWADNTLTYDDNIKDYKYIYADETYTDRFIYAWGDSVTGKEFLNDEIEIIEEEKEIEELDIHSLWLTESQQKEMVLKINELVRELNKIKKEGK